VIPLVRIADYELRDLLGSSGPTETYRARGPRLGATRSLVLKVLRLARLPEEARGPAAARFVAAGQRALAATVGGMGRVLDVGEETAGPFVVSELVPGLDLAHLVALARKRGGALLDPSLAGALCAQVARILTSAHEATPPLPHLGLGPSSVRVTPSAGVMVVDFGLAASLRGLGDQRIASWYFLAPELLTADVSSGFDGSTEAADLYSLGALLFYLLSGRPPVEADSLAQLVERVWEPLPTLPNLPEELTNAIRRLTAPEPQQRPASAREAAEMLAGDVASAHERHQRIANALRRLGIKERPSKTIPVTEPGGAPEITPAESQPKAPALPPRAEPLAPPFQRAARRSQWQWRLGLAVLGVVGVAAGFGLLQLLYGGSDASGRRAPEPGPPAQAPPPPTKLSSAEIPPAPSHAGTPGLDAGPPANVVYRPMPKRKLPRVPGRLNLDTIPSDADVWIDGVLRARTPIDLVMGLGGHRVVVLKEGYRMDRAVYNGDDGEWIRIHLSPVTLPAQTGAYINVRCRGSNHYAILVDDEETGRLCPASMLPVTPGHRRVGVFVPIRRAVVQVDVDVPPGRKPFPVNLPE
jgi:serine/threonine protein kinase